MAGPARKMGVDPGGSEPLLDGLPRVRRSKPLSDQVGQEPGTEVVVTAIGHQHEPAVSGPLRQRRPRSQGRHARHDRHVLPVVLERLGLDSLGGGPESEDALVVVLPLGLVDQGAHHRGCDRRWHGTAHSVRHSTVTGRPAFCVRKACKSAVTASKLSPGPTVRLPLDRSLTGSGSLRGGL
ncbi:hypothetical protein [Propioniciclava flava]